jgi:lipopolysaccharide/colanic/teichoic acid biosynthesis glycosyltransferase
MKPTSPSAERTAPPGDGSGRLHILMLDPLFRLTDRPGSSRTYDIARRFAQDGHRVSVLTTSTGFEGADAGVDGITVTAVHVGTRARFGYPVSGEISDAFVRSVYWRIWQFSDVDAVFTADRPVGALPALLLFCAVRGVPLFLDGREGLPAGAPATAPMTQRMAARGARLAFRWAARGARQVVVLSPGMQAALAAQGVADSRIHVSAPGCHTALFAAQPGASAPALTAYPHLAQGLLVVFAGRMDAARNLEPLLEIARAVQTLLEETGGPLISFALCGDGPARGKLEARALDLGVLNKSLWFLDPLPRRELPLLFGAASAVMIGGESDLTASSALFDALAASRPVILTAQGWQRDLVEGRGAGLALPAHDPPAAARELVDFLKDGDGLRRANQQAAALAAGRFNLDRVTSKLRGLIEDSVAAKSRHAVLRRRTLRMKRALDFTASLTALILLSPALIGLGIAIRIKMGGPVLFRQTRPGLKGKPFQVYKFRTMTDARDASGALLPDSVRLTPFGQFLRRTSLDEIPQLFNVLKGEMSLVGPRPLLPEYMPYYTPEQHRRHDVMPGITGWAQINGRNSITWEEKFAKDVWYVNNLSLALDLKIIIKTVWIVMSGRGVAADGHATFERFDEIMARRQGAEDV